MLPLVLFDRKYPFSKNSVILRHFWVKLCQKCPFLQIPDAALKLFITLCLYLLSKHFPQNHTMHKIFHRNTVKISFSCLRNISSIISSYNCNILLPKQQSFGCNCRVNECPLNGECQIPSVIYRADMVDNFNNEENVY